MLPLQTGTIPVFLSLSFAFQVALMLFCCHLPDGQVLLPAQVCCRDWPEGLWRLCQLRTYCCTESNSYDVGSMHSSQGQLPDSCSQEYEWFICIQDSGLQGLPLRYSIQQ